MCDSAIGGVVGDVIASHTPAMDDLQVLPDYILSAVARVSFQVHNSTNFTPVPTTLPNHNPAVMSGSNVGNASLYEAGDQVCSTCDSISRNRLNVDLHV